MYNNLTLNAVVNINCYAERRMGWLMQKSVQSSIECSSLSLPVKGGAALHAFDLEGNSIQVIHCMHQGLI